MTDNIDVGDVSKGRSNQRVQWSRLCVRVSNASMELPELLVSIIEIWHVGIKMSCTSEERMAWVGQGARMYFMTAEFVRVLNETRFSSFIDVHYLNVVQQKSLGVSSDWST